MEPSKLEMLDLHYRCNCEPVTCGRCGEVAPRSFHDSDIDYLCSDCHEELAKAYNL